MLNLHLDDDLIAISCYLFFFFNETATTEIYTLSLHDALPIFHANIQKDGTFSVVPRIRGGVTSAKELRRIADVDRKSTRLNSSHSQISYAVFCLKKKKTLDDSYRRANITSNIQDIIHHLPYDS